MQNYEVHYTRASKNDILEIYAFLESQVEKEVATKLIKKIRDRVRTLIDVPEAGQRLFIRDNIRCISFKQYKIFYRVRKNDRAVDILRVLHSKRNIRNADIIDEIGI